MVHSSLSKFLKLFQPQMNVTILNQTCYALLTLLKFLRNPTKKKNKWFRYIFYSELTLYHLVSVLFE